jgi:hypothetical protein
MKRKLLAVIISFSTLVSCSGDKQEADKEEQTPNEMQELLDKYTSFKLTADLSHLSEDQKEMIRLLIRASKYMDELFWYEAYGDKDALLAGIKDSLTKEFVKINYGPWDRLNGNEPFVETFGEKPAGANFYPKDMTKEEFEAADIEDKESQYTLIRRNDEGELYSIPYHEAFKEQIEKTAALLKEASELAEDPGFKKYLQLRSEALLTDQYRESDMAWMDMKTNPVEVVIGPIENYEDKLYNYKSAHEAYVLIKDLDWSRRLEKYAAFLPELQEACPFLISTNRKNPAEMQI